MQIGLCLVALHSGLRSASTGEIGSFGLSAIVTPLEIGESRREV